MISIIVTESAGYGSSRRFRIFERISASGTSRQAREAAHRESSAAPPQSPLRARRDHRRAVSRVRPPPSFKPPLRIAHVMRQVTRREPLLKVRRQQQPPVRLVGVKHGRHPTHPRSAMPYQITHSLRTEAIPCDPQFLRKLLADVNSLAIAGRTPSSRSRRRILDSAMSPRRSGDLPTQSRKELRGSRGFERRRSTLLYVKFNNHKTMSYGSSMKGVGQCADQPTRLDPGGSATK